MTTPHKWVKEISHYINGGEVECCVTDRDTVSNWYSVDSLCEFDNNRVTFRIKPKKKTLSVAVFAYLNGGVFVSQNTQLSSHTRVSDWVEIEYKDES